MGDEMVNAPTARQSFLARQALKRHTTVQPVEEIEEQVLSGNVGEGHKLGRGQAVSGQITIEHQTDEKVKLWKRGPYGWFPCEVPAHTIRNNLANGWMEFCPDCQSTDCTLDPNTCPAKRGRRYLVCPVVQAGGAPCGKRIFATGLLRAKDRVSGEFELTGVYDQVTAEMELKAKMDMHIMTYHRDEARILGLFNQPRVLPVGVEQVESPEEIRG